MPKFGQARVPTDEERALLFNEIKKHRYPEKNTAIMQISFKLGLRVQEISLLQLKEVCRLGPVRKTIPRTFELYKVMSLPAAYTKGANALRESGAKYQRKHVRFTVEKFNEIVSEIESLVILGKSVDPKQFYPSMKTRKGTSRDLPLVDDELRSALKDYIRVRLDQDPFAQPTDPLFLNQQSRAYSPNTLQEHMALMLRDWASIEKASSHSGRRSLITDIIYNQKQPVQVAQRIAGHASASTTIGYGEPPEEQIAKALDNLFQVDKH